MAQTLILQYFGGTGDEKRSRLIIALAQIVGGIVYIISAVLLGFSPVNESVLAVGARYGRIHGWELIYAVCRNLASDPWAYAALTLFFVGTTGLIFMPMALGGSRRGKKVSLYMFGPLVVVFALASALFACFTVMNPFENFAKSLAVGVPCTLISLVLSVFYIDLCKLCLYTIRATSPSRA